MGSEWKGDFAYIADNQHQTFIPNECIMYTFLRT